jgi:hypothetical protein
VVEWITLRISNVRISDRLGFKPRHGQVVVSVSKKLYTHCLASVGSRNGFESVSISLKLPKTKINLYDNIAIILSCFKSQKSDSTWFITLCFHITLFCRSWYQIIKKLHVFPFILFFNCNKTMKIMYILHQNKL